MLCACTSCPMDELQRVQPYENKRVAKSPVVPRLLTLCTVRSSLFVTITCSYVACRFRCANTAVQYAFCHFKYHEGIKIQTIHYEGSTTENMAARDLGISTYASVKHGYFGNTLSVIRRYDGDTIKIIKDPLTFATYQLKAFLESEWLRNPDITGTPCMQMSRCFVLSWNGARPSK